MIVSLRQRTWWRNLRGSSEVKLCLQGREVTGRGIAIEDERRVAEALGAYFRSAPQYAKYFHVALEADGQPKSTDLEREAKNRVVIQVELG